jgi:hypothetical protein
MTPGDEHQNVAKVVAAQLAEALLNLAKGLEGHLSSAEIGEILIGVGVGLLGFDLGPAGVVAKLRETAAGIERAAVNPDPRGRTN